MLTGVLNLLRMNWSPIPKAYEDQILLKNMSEYEEDPYFNWKGMLIN